jgi:hypothetical protein
MSLKQQEPQKGIKGPVGRLNAATRGGVLGIIAGKVKFREEMLVIAAAVLLATPVWKSKGLLVGLAVGIAIIVGGALLIRLRKWRAGAPRNSNHY